MRGRLISGLALKQAVEAKADACTRSLVKELPEMKIGSEVLLSGWLQNLRPSGANRIFAELRDSSGSMQLVFDSSQSTSFESMKRHLKTCPPESIISVKGRLVERPEKDQREGSEMKKFEIIADKLEVLNEAKDLPFNPSQTVNLPAEDFRLKYRFLDLRRAELQENLRVRSELNFFIHQFFHQNGFLEVETPMLFKSTPEGAKEYLVPVEEGKKYALPQSPQQFKQMLMAAGVNKYYQIARCFRQEDLRSDRQPEFTQLDLELSFVQSPEEVMEPVETLVKAIVKEFCGVNITEAFPRLDYDQAINAYGSDKPDIRYAFEIDCVKEEGNEVMEALQLDAIPEKLRPVNNLPSLSEADISLLQEKYPNLESVYASRRPKQCHAGSTPLGKIRTALISKIEEGGLQKYYRDDLVPGKGFIWVQNFPLFKPYTDAGCPSRKFESMHHPFTAPVPEDKHLLETNPLTVRGQHYDLVWNGVEVGGGSLRIHSAELQERIMRGISGMSDLQMEQFSHLLAALRSGCPPHGGIALGLDRFLAMMRGCPSIRDVIAFPKNSKGVDLCANAPN